MILSKCDKTRDDYSIDYIGCTVKFWHSLSREKSREQPATVDCSISITNWVSLRTF